MIIKRLVFLLLVAAASAAGMRTASAEDCLQAGWRDKSGAWKYYRAWVDSAEGGRLRVKYDYHHGTLDLGVFENEAASGKDLSVMKGRWSESGNPKPSGRIRLEMEKGRHRAKGWYTNGEADSAPHYEFVLRECPAGTR